MLQPEGNEQGPSIDRKMQNMAIAFYLNHELFPKPPTKNLSSYQQEILADLVQAYDLQDDLGNNDLDGIDNPDIDALDPKHNPDFSDDTHSINKLGQISVRQNSYGGTGMLAIAKSSLESVRFASINPFCYIPNDDDFRFPAYAITEDVGTNIPMVSTPYGRLSRFVKAPDGHLYEFGTFFYVNNFGDAKVRKIITAQFDPNDPDDSDSETLESLKQQGFDVSKIMEINIIPDISDETFEDPSGWDYERIDKIMASMERKEYDEILSAEF